MSATAIEWATHVWNPFTGCDRVSPGCARCYAATTAVANQRKELGRLRKAAREGKPLPMLRYQNDGDPKSSGPGFAFTVHWDKLERPQRFPAGARVFVNSMSDVFHEAAPAHAIRALLRACEAQPWADFLILTKRAERMRDFVRAYWEETGACGDSDVAPNIWLGVSIENRRFVHRADLLRETPARIRFVSAEPLLGPLVRSPGRTWSPDARGICRRCWRDWGKHAGTSCYQDDATWAPRPAQLNLTGIDWLIVGGESGPGHRPIEASWVNDLLELAQDGVTAFFFKQWGGRTSKAGGRELDGRTWSELPESQAVAA